MKTRSALGAMLQTATNVNEKFHNEHLGQEKGHMASFAERKHTAKIKNFFVDDMNCRQACMCVAGMWNFVVSVTGVVEHVFWHGTRHNLQMTLTMKELVPTMRHRDWHISC